MWLGQAEHQPQQQQSQSYITQLRFERPEKQRQQKTF